MERSKEWCGRSMSEHGVQFATFPETVVPYYPYFAFIQTPYQIITGGEHLKLLEQAVTVSSAATDAISDVCRQAGVVVSIGIMNGITELCTTRSFSSMPTVPCFSGGARSRPPTTSA
jgi:hypothetical protein